MSNLRFRRHITGYRAALLACTMLVPASALASSGTTPSGGKVVTGQATITKSGSTLVIDQTSERAILDWANFDIGIGGLVRFDLPNSQAIELDRIFGPDPAEILGSIRSNGQIVLIDPNGMVFGGGATINTGALTVSTLGISNTDFMAGNMSFTRGGSTGAIINDGTLTARDGGYIALLGPEISNQGRISAKLGMVALASGNEATLDVSGHRLLGVKVDAATVKSEINAGGVISAEGGKVLLTAQAADKLYGGAINVTGVVEANSLSGAGGDVKLVASGDLDLNGARVTANGVMQGGTVETSGDYVNLKSSVVKAAALDGRPGTWLMDPFDIIVTSTAASEIDSALQGGTSVTLETESAYSGYGVLTPSGAGDIVIDSAISWTGNARLTLDAYNGVTVNASMNVGNGGLTINTNVGQSGGRGTFFVQPGYAVTMGETAPLSINGTNYTIINSLASFEDISVSGNYALGSSITAGSSYNFTPIGSSTQPFVGKFEGLGNSLVSVNLTNAASVLLNNLDQNLENPSADLGIFTSIGTHGLVENLQITNAQIAISFIDINSYNYLSFSNIGILAGENAGTIRNVGANGTITANYSNDSGSPTVQLNLSNIGVLLGQNDAGGSVLNSYSSGSVSASTYASQPGGFSVVGGLVGNNMGLVSYSYSSVSIPTIDVETNPYDIGGLVGLNSGTVTTSYATGSISQSSIHTTSIGGLVGENSGLISLSYSSGTVSGDIHAFDVGGLVGTNDSAGVIENTYELGAVRGGDTVGGLVGNNSGQVLTSYATGSVVTSGTGQTPGALVGTNESSGTIDYGYATDGVSGTATASLVSTTVGGSVLENSEVISYTQSFNTSYYNGFNFSSIWYMVPGYTRPFLQSEQSTTIMNAHQLELIALDPSEYYVLGASFSFGSTLSPTNYTSMWNDQYGFVPIGFNPSNSNLSPTEFIGNLDGLGHTITGLSMDFASANYIGLFSWIGSSGGVSNLILSSANVTVGEQYGGILAGENDGAVQSVSIIAGSSGSSLTALGSGTEDEYFGGLVGLQSSTGNISSSSSTASVTGLGNADVIGGLVGKDEGYISASFEAGNVVGSTATTNLGGLVGYESGTIYNSYATGSVSGGNANGTSLTEYIGGLVGSNEGFIYQSSAAGSVTGASGSKIIGGLVGENGGIIEQSFATGAVVGLGNSSYIGGYVGYNTSAGTIWDAYSTGAVSGGSGSNRVGGLVGDNAGVVSVVYSFGSVVGGTSSSTGALIGLNAGSLADGYATGGETSGTAITSLPLVGSGSTGTVDTNSKRLSYQDAQNPYNYAGFDSGSDSAWTIYVGPPVFLWQPNP